jgi:hypothetical protein
VIRPAHVEQAVEDADQETGAERKKMDARIVAILRLAQLSRLSKR